MTTELAKTIVTQLNRRFVYRADTWRWVDNWRIMQTPNGTGVLVGDCEDYSLTLAFALSERSWLCFWWGIFTFRFVIWHCRWNDEGHAVMWVRGEGWVDNIQQRFTDTRPFYMRRGLRFPFLPPYVVLKMALAAICRRVWS